jgi:hypothetical protein
MYVRASRQLDVHGYQIVLEHVDCTVPVQSTLMKRMNASVFAVGITGFIVLISTSTPGARYVGTFFAAIGTFPAIALSITWNANNISDSPTKRAVSVALQSSCGSFGGVIGSYA